MKLLLPLDAVAIARAAAPDRKGLPWTADEDRRITQLRGEGLTAAAIAAIVNRTTPTVFNRLRKLGAIIQNHTPWTDAELNAGVAALDRGLSYRAAAETIGRTESELRWKIRDAGRIVAPRKPAAPTFRKPRSPTSAQLAAAQTHGAIKRDIAKREDTLIVIAKHYGVSDELVARLAREVFPDQRYKAESIVKWTEARITELAARAANPAETLETLAAAFDSTPRMIDRVMRDNGLRALKRVRFGLTEANAGRARELAAAGLTITPTAQTIGVDPRTLTRWAAQEGVVFAVRQDRPPLPATPKVRAPTAGRPTTARKVDAHALERQATALIRKAQRAEAERKTAEARAARDSERARIRADRVITEPGSKAEAAKATVEARTARELEREASAILRSAARAEADRKVVERRLARNAERERIRAERLAAKAEAKAATAKAKAEAKEARDRDALVAEAKARTAKLEVMLKAARRRPPKKAAPILDPRSVEAMVAAHIAAHGVTRPVETDEDRLIRAIRARGYAVVHTDDAFRIDAMIVPAAELAVFAERRHIAVRSGP